MKTVKDIFFYYLLESGEQLFRATLATTSQPRDSGLEDRAKYQGMRESALAELRTIELIVTNNEANPNYTTAYRDFQVRMRSLNYPPQLTTEEGLRTYYDYLMKIVKPTTRELRK